MLRQGRIIVAICRDMKIIQRFSSTGNQAKSSADIFEAALRHVNILGWTGEAISAGWTFVTDRSLIFRVLMIISRLGAEDLGMPPVASSSGSDLVLHFNRTSNAKLVESLKAKSEEAKKWAE